MHRENARAVDGGQIGKALKLTFTYGCRASIRAMHKQTDVLLLFYSVHMQLVNTVMLLAVFLLCITSG